MKSYDYLVVGGGSAGAVVAARLSENPALSVALIEAGGAGTSPFIQIPNGAYFIKGNARYHWLNKLEADPTRNNRQEKLNCGKGLGGGSSINGLEFLKGIRSDFERWEAEVGPEWSVAAVDRAYGKVEKAVSIVAPKLHTTARKFIGSAVDIGFPRISSDLPEVRNGVMPTPTNAGGGIRQSTRYSYLRPAARRQNLTILTNCMVSRLIIEGGRAVGVAYVKDGREEIVHANAEVILSAGAINTPQLLMLSGIGPADHLQSVGIKPVLDQPGIGRGLQDHPAVWVSVKVKERSWNDDLSLMGKARVGLQWLLTRSGSAASGIAQASLFGSSQSLDSVPEYQMHFVPAGYVVHDTGVSFIPSSSVSAAVSLCRPSGQGHVRLRSSRFDDAPVISYRLLDSQEDIRIMIAACRKAREIYGHNPMRGTVTEEVSPGPNVQSDSDWEAYIRQHAMNMCHPSASCRMGKDTSAPVDARLRLRGIEGLRVADASVMPGIVSANTNGPSIMIGERAAEFILQGA